MVVIGSVDVVREVLVLMRDACETDTLALSACVASLFVACFNDASLFEVRF